MTDLRARFAVRFGEDLAKRLEAGIEHHVGRYPLPLDRGSKRSSSSWSGRWASAAFWSPRTALPHSVTASWADLVEWLRDEAELGSMDGTMDLAGRAEGRFDLILGPCSEAEYEAGLEAAYAYRLASEPVAGEA